MLFLLFYSYVVLGKDQPPIKQAKTFAAEECNYFFQNAPNDDQMMPVKSLSILSINGVMRIQESTNFTWEQYLAHTKSKEYTTIAESAIKCKLGNKRKAADY